ncbi:MAG: hypothetical protein ABSG49_07620 [Methanoregula sp.]|jgi:uncharacterized protein (UPF0332 family)|uniref:hypothetical protein n=1 Tax=Methanoregula sp. TaxID=2052170 RepID=UPI003C260F26
MVYQWYDYLIFARNLRTNPAFIECTCDKETLNRCIVSRAYYAAFHYAKDCAEKKQGFKFRTDGIHDAVRNWYWSHNKKAAFNDLRDLSKLRNHCDYDDVVPDLDNLIVGSLKTAERIHHET